jgi:signal transduction histidine kinase
MHAMGSDSIDPRWHRLLGLAVHELRTPITVVAGYLRMVLKERAGPISEQQRKLLEEAEKSCGRLSALVAEMSDLSSLESGTATLNRGTVDLRTVLTEAVAAVPPLPDREVTIELDPGGIAPAIQGDATRLRTAFLSLFAALRRELVTSDRLIVRPVPASGSAQGAFAVAIAAPDQIDSVASADPATLAAFDEWRGGSGLSLAIARRIINQHGGTLHDPPGGGKAAGLVVLPPA